MKIAVLDKQTIILVKTSLGEDMMALICVLIWILQALTWTSSKSHLLFWPICLNRNYVKNHNYVKSFSQQPLCNILRLQQSVRDLPSTLSRCCHSALTLVLGRPIRPGITCSMPWNTVLTALADHPVLLHSCHCKSHGSSQA